jgi:hypothetical protein
MPGTGSWAGNPHPVSTLISGFNASTIVVLLPVHGTAAKVPLAAAVGAPPLTAMVALSAQPGIRTLNVS